MKDIVKKEVDNLLELMNIQTDYSVDIEETEGVSYISICFDGDNLGYLIGNHGKHLDSFQYVLQLILRNKLGEDADFRLLLDVCGYRKERDTKLEKFAMQKADDARILGETIDLPPMKPSDRRIIHMTLQKFDDIKTESVGEGRDRYVRIIPSSDMDFISNDEENEDSEE